MSPYVTCLYFMKNILFTAFILWIFGLRGYGESLRPRDLESNALIGVEVGEILLRLCGGDPFKRVESDWIRPAPRYFGIKMLSKRLLDSVSRASEPKGMPTKPRTIPERSFWFRRNQRRCHRPSCFVVVDGRFVRNETNLIQRQKNIYHKPPGC